MSKVAAKLEKLAGSEFHRAFGAITKVDEESRSIELAFSSDAEIERWPGTIEVLSHGEGAVLLNRINDGGALLFNHDLDRQIGVIETARIDADGKGRARVRFGKSPFAEEKWQDVRDGILTKVSVGYRIREVKLVEERDDGSDVFLVTKWEPNEISLVTAPVDTSVGIGRSTNNEPKPQNFTRNIMNKEQMIALLKGRGLQVPDNATDADLVRMLNESEPKPQKVDIEAERASGRKTEMDRVRSISEAGRKYRKPELAQSAIEEGKTTDEFRQMLLDEVDSDNKGIIDGSKPIGLTGEQARSFSMVKLVRALSDASNKKFREDAAFELDACRAAEDQSGRSARGTMVPVDVLMTPLQTRGDTVSIKSGAGYTGSGGTNVETRLLSSSFIELLRNRSVLMGLGTQLSGLVGDVDIPKQISGATGYWIGEDEDAPKEDIEFGLVQLRNHTVANYGEITRKMLMQSSLSVEALFRADLARGLALAVDSAGFYGDGGSNEPVGILETSGINATDFVATQPTFAELVAMETAISLDNADVSSMAYIGNAALRGHAKTTKKFADTSAGGTIWEPGDMINGYRTEVTNQVVTGDVFFGNFADLLIAMWGGLDITVDPYTHSTKGRIRIVCMQDFDFAVRRASSFGFGQKAAA